ncbi:CamS family sex pheromone protein [Aquibacillus kalidii]|uniref:CamS family sex pheromone protein n=1 Tax=Aquibacillus kalidii TaxID=2762597 RepID=UPI0016446685|nr:CamS family sex pheromone protein [Aquibacillus kalidii]
MKRKSLLLLSILLILTSCAPSFNKKEENVVEENKEDVKQETAIIPSYNLSDDNYRVLIDYKISKSRGVIVNQVANRLDIDQLEEGLRRHSKDTFDTDKYYFQEGQYITEDIVYEWLERYVPKEGELGLNPEIKKTDNEEEEKKQQQNNPKYLSHILEQDYLTKTDDDIVRLGGISIGIAMKSVYRFQTEIGGPYYYEKISKEEMMKEANRVAKEVVQRARQIKGLEQVPIMLALYREEAQDSLVPGNFVAKTTVAKGSSSVKDWETIKEKHVLFPSNEAKKDYPDTWANLTDFESDVAEYFPNYVSVIGKGFYVDDQLRKLTIEIPITFNGKAEVIGFTQYVYGLVMEGFQNHYDLEINITSSDKQESLITREAGEDEAYVHIYH